MRRTPWIPWYVLLVALGFLHFGCKPSGSGADRADVQFALVIQPHAGVAPWKVVHLGMEDLPLEEPRRFRIGETSLSSDPNGYPAVGFRIDPAQKQAFTTWTGDNVGRRMAILIDGEVVAAPVVQSALPGEGVITFESEHKTIDEVRTIANRIVGTQ